EDDGALGRGQALQQALPVLRWNAHAQDLLKALQRSGRTGTGEQQLVVLVGAQALLDVLGGLVREPGSESPRGTVLCMGVGVERQHGTSQGVLDRPEVSARSDVVGVGYPPLAVRGPHAGALIQEVLSE